VKFYCIGDEDTVRGFHLAGVPGRVVTSAAEAKTALEESTADPELGILILTQAANAWMREQVDTLRLERDRPLIVEIPGPGGRPTGGQTLRQLVHSAVGISLDARKGA
jgi:vacuolar-type H+-ATPase subunit F/Vma7